MHMRAGKTADGVRAQQRRHALDVRVQNVNCYNVTDAEMEGPNRGMLQRARAQQFA
jgi:hypothetical protein